MALTDDQRAMLRLLAQREQGYDDIAALMGLSVDEVRAKVKDALGRGRRVGRRRAPSRARGRAAETPVRPRRPPEVAPPPAPAKEPELAEAGREAPGRAAQVAQRLRHRPRSASARPRAADLAAKDHRRLAGGVGRDRGRLILVILILALGGGGSSSSSSTGRSTDGSGGPKNGRARRAANPEAHRGGALTPVGGGNASGERCSAGSRTRVVLQVEAKGLAPSPEGPVLHGLALQVAEEQAAAGRDQGRASPASSPGSSRSPPKCSPTSPAAPSTRSTSP